MLTRPKTAYAKMLVAAEPARDRKPGPAEGPVILSARGLTVDYGGGGLFGAVVDGETARREDDRTLPLAPAFCRAPHVRPRPASLEAGVGASAARLGFDDRAVPRHVGPVRKAAHELEIVADEDKRRAIRRRSAEMSSRICASTVTSRAVVSWSAM